jgi:hypothetical protein
MTQYELVEQAEKMAVEIQKAAKREKNREKRLQKKAEKLANDPAEAAWAANWKRLREIQTEYYRLKRSIPNFYLTEEGQRLLKERDSIERHKDRFIAKWKKEQAVAHLTPEERAIREAIEEYEEEERKRWQRIRSCRRVMVRPLTKLERDALAWLKEEHEGNEFLSSLWKQTDEWFQALVPNSLKSDEAISGTPFPTPLSSRQFECLIENYQDAIDDES